MSLRNLWPRLTSWLERENGFALATVVAAHGSSPRAAGACMAASADGERFVGSVSSGCLEIEVLDAAREVMRSGGVRRLRFGPDGAPPWKDGLTCGGWTDVRVEPWWGCQGRDDARETADAVARWMNDDAPGVVVCSDDTIAHVDRGGWGGGVARLAPAARRRAETMLQEERAPEAQSIDAQDYFFHALPRRPRLFLVGAVDVAVHLSSFAQHAGFAVSVVDPRSGYIASAAFPLPPQNVQRAWPQAPIGAAGLGPRDAAVVLTHDPKIDDPALLALLETSAGYIGALGSQRSHAARLERLQDAGQSAASLERIHGPAGIHLGAGDAAGIALGILAGIVRWQAAQQRAASIGAPAAAGAAS